MTLKRVTAFLAAAALTLFIGAGVASATNNHDGDDNGHRNDESVWICHATAGYGELKNGYNLIEVDVASTQFTAHQAHATTDPKHNAIFGVDLYDIIPAPGGAYSECGGPRTPPTTVPETTVPETTVPDTTIPATTVPETTAPETTVPVTTTPDTTAPATTEAPTTTVAPTTVPVTTEAPTTTVQATDIPPIPTTVAPTPLAPPATPVVTDTALPTTGGEHGRLLLIAALVLVFGAMLTGFAAWRKPATISER